MKSLHLSIIVILATSLVIISNHAYADNVTNSYGGLVGFRVAEFKSNDSTYQIWYKITNATVTSTPLDLPAKALIFFIDATNDGQLIVELPRTIIDSKNQDTDKPYFVTIDEVNIGVSKANVAETSDNYTRTLKINFTKDTSEIEIVGNLFAAKYPITKTNFILPPLQQFRSGILVHDIKCNSNFQLIFKSEDGLPACVKPESVAIFIERGWARQELYHDINVEPKITLNDYFYNGIDKENNMTISINNQTYYQTTLDYSAYNLPKATSIQFQNVVFTFPEGTLATPGGAFVVLDVKFQDGFEETYGMHTENEFGGIQVPTQSVPRMAVNSTIVLSNHMEPQAGMTIYHDRIKLLVSK